MANSVINGPNQRNVIIDGVSCRSEDDIDNALRGMILDNFKGIKWLNLNVNVSGLPLGGGQWTVLMSQISTTYCTFIAFIYSSSGCVIRGRSLINGNLTSWKDIA